jgi:hypothetical protein
VRRPLSVTLTGLLFALSGAAGIVYHAPEWMAARAAGEPLWALAVRLLALLAGVFLLRGASWARWWALLWLAYHVVLSAFHTRLELIVHAAFFVAIAWVLLRPPAAAYFDRSRGGGAPAEAR